VDTLCFRQKSSPILHSEMLATELQVSAAVKPHQPARTSSEQVVSLPERTNALVRGLKLVLHHHGAGVEVLAQLESQLCALLNTSLDETVWLQRAKWTLTYPLAKYLRNELPASCDRNFVPSGCLRQWMRQRLTVFSRRNTHLWYSWLQAKRSALPASDAIVEATYKKHLEALTSPDPGVDSTIDKIFQDPCFQRVLEKTRNSLTQRLRESPIFTELAPSTSACYELPRSLGGQQTTLVVVSGLQSEIYVEDGVEIAADDGFVDPVMEELPPTEKSWRDHLRDHRDPKAYEAVWSDLVKIARDFRQSNLRVEDEHGEPRPKARVSQLSSPNTTGGTDLVRMRFYPVVHSYNGSGRMTNVCAEVREPLGRSDWTSLLDVYKSRNYGRPLRAVIQAVLEPFKVRVISKGESLPYYAMKPLQKALHGAMRSMPCFRLIGRPFSPCDVLDLAAKAESSWEWFSVDYSAATDGLSWKYSGRILRFLLGNLDSQTYEYALRALGPHELLYPERRKDKWGAPVSKGLQTNGQLMGSILSFPILCLANLGVYLKVTAGAQRGWSDKERLAHVLVNGDDMVYAATPSLWEKHTSVAGKVGLKMSVGKAYHHPTYLNVNSTSCHFDLAAERVRHVYRGGDDLEIPRTPWQIDFLNVGLFFGQHKVLGRSDGDPENEMSFVSEGESRGLAAAHYGNDPAAGYCANVNRLLAGSLPGKQASLLGLFISTNSREIARECLASIDFADRARLHTRNMFLPISRGGMGVEPPVSWKFRVSKHDRYIAATMHSNFSGKVSFGLPLPGWEPQSMDEVTCPWVEKREWLPLAMDQIPRWRTLWSVSRRTAKLPVYGWSASPSAVAR